MTKQPFSNFDLPRQHLGEQGHYIPPKARSEAEIARRRALPAGTLVAEEQVKGLQIAHNILKQVEPGESMAFTTKMLGMAAINSSWYTFGKGAPDVMRRRLMLPKVADHETDWRMSAQELRQQAMTGLTEAHGMAAGVAAATAENKLTVRRARAFGRYIGNVSLRLAVLDDGKTTMGGDAFEVQKEVRDKALDLLEFSREFGANTQSHPSIAQLANPDSPLGVHWRNEAPNGAFTAYKQAITLSS